MIVQFRNEKVSNHGSIPITIDCNVVAFIVFEEGFHQPIKRTKQLLLKRRCHYLPHRGVYKEYLTTQLRPVFDAACKEKGKFSLNDCLEKRQRKFCGFSKKCFLNGAEIDEIRSQHPSYSFNKYSNPPEISSRIGRNQDTWPLKCEIEECSELNNGNELLQTTKHENKHVVRVADCTATSRIPTQEFVWRFIVSVQGCNGSWDLTCGQRNGAIVAF
ncbi:hypothetical protein TNCV_3848661 [Trichonephila clavipes]|uniref:Uncharacterized protein n=1 Tax=Trichonephila clavipes TaxID=2585209 RepID=A0A8X6REM6_TRICX|nr:hypothetical protein TNCV_3848661 [Trichonephila clavipes]